jgi:hypothetical protein
MAKIAPLLACAAFAASAVTASAQAPDPALSSYLAATAPGPLEKLVLCDATAFLATGPDLDADLVIARRDGRPHERLLPPYFVTNGFLYKQGYDRLFDKLRRQKEATREQLAQAQGTLGKDLIDYYRQRRSLPPSFVREQLAFCQTFAKSYGVNPDW